MKRTIKEIKKEFKERKRIKERKSSLIKKEKNKVVFERGTSKQKIKEIRKLRIDKNLDSIRAVDRRKNKLKGDTHVK